MASWFARYLVYSSWLLVQAGPALSRTTNACAQSGYQPITCFLVSKVNDHAFWNGRWGDYWACRGKPLGRYVPGEIENRCGEISGSGWILCDGDLSLGSEGFGSLQSPEQCSLHLCPCPGRVDLRQKNRSVQDNQG